MLIDWFTVVAQAMNFMILVWLMKRVLYKPIMAAIDAREALVAAELANAAAKSLAANQSAEQFRVKIEAFEQERSALLIKATAESKAQASTLIEAARAEAESLQSKRRDALDLESKDFREGLGRRTHQAFFSLARRAFRDLADSSLEEQLAAVFCVRLRALDPSNRETLGAALQMSAEPASVRVAMQLSPALEKEVQIAVNEVFGRPVSLRFEVAPELVSGIELAAHGQRIGWSVADYLDGLEHAVAADAPGGPPAAVGGTPLVTENTASTLPALRAAC